MTVGLLSYAVVMLIIWTLLGYRRVERLQAQIYEERTAAQYRIDKEDARHLWTQIRAQVLRDAAEDYDTVEAATERKVLSWSKEASIAQTSVVSVWLNERADKIEGIDRG